MGAEAAGGKSKSRRSSTKDEMDALGREFVDKIPEELGGVKDEMRTIGVNGIRGMIDGMYSRSGALYSAAASIVSQAIAAMRAAADIHSPSKKSKQNWSGAARAVWALA